MNIIIKTLQDNWVSLMFLVRTVILQEEYCALISSIFENALLIWNEFNNDEVA